MHPLFQVAVQLAALEHLLVLCDDLLGIAQDLHPFFRGGHAVGQAVEQAHIQLILNGFDDGAEGGLPDVHFFRGGGNRFALFYFQQVIQMFNLHGLPLLRMGYRQYTLFYRL